MHEQPDAEATAYSASSDQSLRVNEQTNFRSAAEADCKESQPPVKQLTDELEQAAEKLEQCLGELDAKLEGVKTARPPATADCPSPIQSRGSSPLATRLDRIANNLEALNRFAGGIIEDLEV